MHHQNFNPLYRPSPPASQKRHKSSSSSSGAQHASHAGHEDRDEPSGDELDDISARDIAMARYKRNHDYLSEIFTPYNADHIVPPPLDIFQTSDELQKLMEEQTKLTQQQKADHDDKLQQFRQERDEFWAHLHKLNDATTLDALYEQERTMAALLDAKVEIITERAYPQQIPGLKDEPLPSPPPKAEPAATESPATSAPATAADLTMSSATEASQSPQLQQQPQQQEHDLAQQHQQHSASSTSSPLQSLHQQQQHHAPSDPATIQQQQQQQQQQPAPEAVKADQEDVDMYTNFDQQQEAGSNDDFFNEMLNTNDDDPTVNEFMDFEQEKSDDAKE
ncbi:hypothetical protein BC940DRAFT_316381 [Gongronella butleri]|nr:hypothetical protein BC940DRAFT_316381 [Gongronella butleri]